MKFKTTLPEVSADSGPDETAVCTEVTTPAASVSHWASTSHPKLHLIGRNVILHFKMSAAYDRAFHYRCNNEVPSPHLKVVRRQGWLVKAGAGGSKAIEPRGGDT